MCEVQGLGAPGSTGGASPPPERLSVSSSEDEEDQKAPRHSLLSHSEKDPSQEPLEGTSNSRDEPWEDEASKVHLMTLNNKEEGEEQVEGKEREEEKEEEEEKMKEDETEKVKEKLEEKEDVEEAKEEEKEKEKEHDDSDSEAKDVQGSVCDENEKENLENERRDELLENTVKIECEVKEEKMAHASAEENRRGNDEEASASDSPKDDEPQRQKEEEEDKEEVEEGKKSKDKQEDVNKTEEKEMEMEENGKEKLKENGKEKLKEDEKEVEEGLDPFSPKCRKDAPTTHKVSKTVNFLESELKTTMENKRHTINSFSSSKAKEEGDAKEEDMLRGAEVDEKTTKYWSLGEGNPVYRLSLKLSPNLFNTTDIPGANQHKEAEKAGFLTKLSGRSFPYIAQWKRRYCVLSKGRLYYYEREDSKAGDKSNGVIQLEYFDQVAEAGPKECKKATNVFIITSQDRSFFDPGRHVFSADTLPDMKDWIRKFQAALDQIRNNNRPAASSSPSASPSAKEGGGKRRREEAAESKEGKGSQTQTTTTTAKERRKKKEQETSRPRKSSRVGVSNQTQTPMVEPMTCEPDGGRPAMTVPKGGVMLPGFSSLKDPQTTNRPAERRSGDGEADDLPQAGPTLSCVTKQRVKGPQGRRVPQNHRRKAAAALKKRASSLSALEHQDANDNREAPWLNRSLDVLEGGNPRDRKQVGAAVPSAALPYKAYNYSSDEDDMDDDQSDSFPLSASGMPPPLPPRSASYGLELMRSASQGGAAPRERQVPHCSLDDPRDSQGDLVGSRDSVGGWRGSHEEAWGDSRGSLCQNGRASPVMDDLDNLLMNQSVQHASAALDSVSDAGSEGSSTCRATDNQQPSPALDHCHHHHHHLHHQVQQTQQPRKKSQDLSRFATAVRHLQRHVVEIDRAVFAVTGDVASTRREVATLREAVAALQADVDTITTTLSNLTQEAITAQQKISFATQEAEKVQLSVREALREAERTRQEQLKSKREYEELVAEMKVALQLFREANPAPVPIPAQDLASDTTPTPVAKSSSNSQGVKGASGYQSIFSKSSSIISGFTSRHSLSKSVSFADQKEKRKSDGAEAKGNSLDRNKKYDKKDKKDAKSQAPADSKEKENKTQTSRDKKDKHSNTMEKKESKQHQHKQKPLPVSELSDLRRLEDGEGERKGLTSLDRRERRARQEGRDKRDHVISPLSLEDIPMADDAIQEYEAKVEPISAPSTASDAGEAPPHKASFKQTLSITLGQSSTSTAGASSRPHMLRLNRERHSDDLSTSNTSPESPLAPSSFTRPGSFLPTLEESPPVSEATSLSSLHQPGSTPGPQARQGTMSTVQKDRATANPPQSKRPGTFAISRQHSSPNIPLQRQNSGSAFPIQRQQSLGTVPEGRLPRQESLTSVPEDRPLVDRTLPLSPSPSLTYFPLSPTASSSTLSDTARRAARESMELVTGPVLAGSAIQEANATGTLPVMHLDDQDMQPAATSSLKRTHGPHSDNVGILV